MSGENTAYIYLSGTWICNGRFGSMPPMRIVSLLPSATEIVCALIPDAPGRELVGVSHECDFPASVRDLPRLTRPKIDAEAGSRAIHESVAEKVKAGLSLYEIDVELLAELKPDVVITQDQCAVCAVSLTDVESALQEMVSSRPKICSLQPKTLKDVSESFLQVGVMTDRFKDGVKLAKDFWDKLHSLSKLAPPPEERPRVACIEWLDPIMLAGHWTPELVKLAGGVPIIVGPDQKFSTVTIEELLQAEPDLVTVFPCGFSLEKANAEMNRALKDSMGWKILKECARLGMFVSDGNQFFNRSGPRLVESAEILACAIGTAGDDLKEKHRKHLEEVL